MPIVGVAGDPKETSQFVQRTITTILIYRLRHALAVRYAEDPGLTFEFDDKSSLPLEDEGTSFSDKGCEFTGVFGCGDDIARAFA